MTNGVDWRIYGDYAIARPPLRQATLKWNHLHPWRSFSYFVIYSGWPDFFTKEELALAQCVREVIRPRNPYVDNVTLIAEIIRGFKLVSTAPAPVVESRPPPPCTSEACKGTEKWEARFGWACQYCFEVEALPPPLAVESRAPRPCSREGCEGTETWDDGFGWACQYCEGGQYTDEQRRDLFGWENDSETLSETFDEFLANPGV